MRLIQGFNPEKVGTLVAKGAIYTAYPSYHNDASSNDNPLTHILIDVAYY